MCDAGGEGWRRETSRLTDPAVFLHEVAATTVISSANLTLESGSHSTSQSAEVQMKRGACVEKKNFSACFCVSLHVVSQRDACENMLCALGAASGGSVFFFPRDLDSEW